MGIRLTKLGLTFSKRTSQSYLKYDLGVEFVGRTLRFAQTILFGVFLNALTSKAETNLLFVYLGALALVQLVEDLSTNYLSYKSTFYRRFSEEAIFDLVLEKYQSIPIKFRNEPKFVEIQRNLNLNSVSGFISTFLVLFSQVYSIILSFLAITIIDINLFFIAILVGLISLYFKSLSQFRGYDYRDEYRYNNNLLRMSSGNFFYNMVNSLNDNLIINNNRKFLYEIYQKYLKKYYDYNKNYFNSVDKLRVYSNYLLDIAGAITLVLIYYNGIEGAIPVGTLTILVTTYTSFTFGLSTLGNYVARILGDFLEVKSVNDLLDYSVENKNLENLKSKKNFKIEFKNVSFKYPETEEYVLKNVNLEFKKGDKIGIIGQNGAGKSTLVKLLFKIYSPTEGEILLNGQNIYDINDEDYFNTVKALSQSPRLEEGLSVSQIIHLGNSEKKLDIKKIKWAAKMSGSDEVIKKLKNGYDQKIATDITLINKYSEEKYETLSPGQARRIQIAKVFYCEKPIVILDEPTSNVDPLATKEVFDNLAKLKNNEILIIVAHDVLRLNNVVNKILVMEEGRVVEFGNREELLKDENSSYNKTISTYNSKNIIVEKN